jgi:hypothetical protein
MSIAARRELVNEIAPRYRSAGKAEKERILDELVATTAYDGKHAMRLHKDPPPPAREKRPRKRKRTYGQAERGLQPASGGRTSVRPSPRPGRLRSGGGFGSPAPGFSGPAAGFPGSSGGVLDPTGGLPESARNAPDPAGDISDSAGDVPGSTVTISFRGK